MRIARAEQEGPVQLELGDRVAAEIKILTGTVGKDTFAVVPKEYGRLGRLLCNARLAQDTGVIQMAGQTIRNLSAWTTTSKTKAKRNNGGEWEEWDIPEGSTIGVSSKQVRDKKSRIVPDITKKVYTS